MQISEIKKLDKELKGFILVGRVAAIYKSKEIKGTKNNKTYCFVSTSTKIEDDTGEIYVQFTDVKDDFKNGEGQVISCISCSINDYEDKHGVMQRSLRARDYSFDVIPADPAHPELPKTKIIPQEPKTPTYTAPTKKEDVQSNIWIEKDLRIVRQHETSDAVALVCKYFKGSLEEATAQVILTSNMLVDNVYQGLAHPIKKKTQAELLNDMQENSDKNVADAAENVEKLNNTARQEDELPF